MIITMAFQELDVPEPENIKYIYIIICIYIYINLNILYPKIDKIATFNREYIYI